MAQVIITFDIIEYLPSDFKFDNFSFIISSENREFEQEILYVNRNQVTHKASLNKKDLKYSIKVTRNSSLIGITDLIIPHSILSKKESTFDKTCSITMTDSIKRVLFGNTSSSNFLKINIHLTLQYKEKKEKEQSNKYSSVNSSKKPKMPERSESSGIGSDSQNQKESIHSSNAFSQRNQLANKKISNIRKQRSSSKPKSNIKSHTMKPKTQIFTNNKLKEVQKAILDEEKNEEVKKAKNKNESFIDEELRKEVKDANPQITNFMKEFSNKYPLDKLNSFSDVNNLMEHTRNILEELLDYQLQFYDAFNKSFLTKNKFKQLMIQYNNKLRNVKKEMNKIDEENDLYDIKEEINDKNNFNDIRELIPLKENELDNFKELCGNYLDKISPDNNNANNEKDKVDDKKSAEEKTHNLLIRILSHNLNKYGPINNIFTQTNSTESERLNIRRLATKYNLPLNGGNTEEKHNENVDNKNEGANENNKEEPQPEKKEEKNEEIPNDIPKENLGGDGKITKWEYVSTEKIDKIDKSLELYLKYFYSKRSFPKIMFRKTSTNNYEYGTQKVMIKIEGDTIRVRYVGGYLLLDKFIELNAATEEKKLKKQSEKSNNVNNKKNKKK